MSLSLKHIPCPAGPNCSAYKCLFGGHATDNDGLTPPEASGSSQKDEAVNSGNDSDTGSSRKAPRLDSPQTTSSRSTPNAPASRPTLPDGDRLTPAPSVLHSFQRSISPPPKKQSARVTPVPVPTPTEPVKQESLNPRLLKHSPASHEIRLKLVKLLYAEYKRLNGELKRDAKNDEQRLVLSDQAIIKRVLDEEEAVAVGKASVYANVMKNSVMKYKRLQVAEWLKEREKEAPVSKKRQHDVMEGNAVIVETGLTPAQEVGLLQRLLTPIDGLANYGYIPSIPTEEAIAKTKEGLETAQGWEKCDRCQQRFKVFAGRRAEDGALTSGGACQFHWGKAYFPEKNPVDRNKQPKRYLCCGEQVDDTGGCFTHSTHVFKANSPSRLAAVLNFAATPENPTAPADRAVCFDCEMGYTVYGMELIRLTATSWPDGAEILDVLVRPFGEILDLNSRFSGVWPNDLAQAALWRPGDPLAPPPGSDSDSSYSSGSEDGQVSKKRLKVVSSPAAARELLFSLIAPSTPLIGHGLENDLNAMRIVHPTLVDTVIAFPHKRGLPYRLGLKSLMATHLNRRIQVQQGPEMLGHDSAEDARAAGELVRFRVAREWADMKRAGWKVVDGEIVAPIMTGDPDAETSNNSEGGLTEEFIEAVELAADE
ncbi:RNA exonuclease [Cordyceps javanica]|uniref:RNA exonuclease n=1 Tax=Cordyceps javanica TaxID=43265 RepID=A0A545V0Z7_9HYPO|nr:RNA exonuclease [Cordyceps javanica]TQW02541.1 RNA exonuclease [Cordyceps javanica]